MVELKIDDELRDLLPPLSKDEKDRLEQNMIKDGYLGEPIYIWNGYIVDGHNRYEICKKHNIEFTVEDPFEGKGFEKVNIMEWMIHRQFGKRNLEPFQRLIAVEKYESKIREMARENKSKIITGSNKNRNSNVLQKEENEKYSVKSIHTDKEIAKLAKVGSGTKARWDYVKNNDKTGEVKEKMMTGEIPITRAYDILQAEKKKEVNRIDVSVDKKDTFVKQEVLLDKNKKDVTSGKDEDESIKNTVSNIIADIKTDKTIEDNLNLSKEIGWMLEDNLEYIDGIENKFFNIFKIEDYITKEQKDQMVESLNESIESIKNLVSKIKKIKIKGEK